MAAKVVWAIDIGQTAVRAVKAAAAGDRIEILAFDSVQYKDMLSAPGVDKDSSIQLALRTLVARNRFGSETIAAAIPGQSALVRFIKLPPVEKKRIPDIVRYEAHQQIPFPLEEVVWAYKPMDKGFKEGEQVEVGIFAMRRDIVNRFLSNLMVCDIDVDVLQLAPMALYNMLCFDQPPGQEATLLLDVGAENTELLLATDNSVWPRSLPVAGNDLTQAIMETFKVPFDKAETLKKMAKQSKYSAQIYHAIEPVLKRFVEEVQRSLGFYRSINPGVRISGILALGGAFRLPGMAKYISENLRLPIRSYTEPQNFDISRARNPKIFEEDTVGFGVALGLAVQTLGYGPMDTSLLPPEVIHRKLISRKKPYAAAVAAMAVLALGAAMLNTYQEGQSLKSPDVKKGDEVAKQLDSLNAQYHKNLKVDDVKLKLDQACLLWGGRDLMLQVMGKLFAKVPSKSNVLKEEGVWLTRVVTQHVPYELAAQKIAEGEEAQRSFGSGLKGAPDWEEDPKFYETIDTMIKTSELAGTTRSVAMVGNRPMAAPAPVAAQGKKEDVLRIVVICETNAKNGLGFVTEKFLEPLESDATKPVFVSPVTLYYEEDIRYLDGSGRVVQLDNTVTTKIKEVMTAEAKRVAGEAMTQAEKDEPREADYLAELKRTKGVTQMKFLVFQVAFFVDADDTLVKHIEELKKAAAGQSSVPATNPAVKH